MKKSIYPKTKRLSCTPEPVYITEKLDGSNLVIFKKDDILHIAQRNNIYTIDEVNSTGEALYKGLKQWLNDNIEELSQIRNNSAICGEWMGMGKIKYTIDKFDKKFYMFAKANIDEEFNLFNLYYTHNLFMYPFENLEIPKCIGIVPEVTELNYLPTKETLDKIYLKYVEHEKRDVEGFVINYKDSICKYVRMKNGKLQEHFDRGE